MKGSERAAESQGKTAKGQRNQVKGRNLGFGKAAKKASPTAPKLSTRSSMVLSAAAKLPIRAFSTACSCTRLGLRNASRAAEEHPRTAHRTFTMRMVARRRFERREQMQLANGREAPLRRTDSRASKAWSRTVALSRIFITYPGINHGPR